MNVQAVHESTVKILALIGISLFGLSQIVILDTAEETVQSVITIASAAVAELCLFPVNHFLHYR